MISAKGTPWSKEDEQQKRSIDTYNLEVGRYRKIVRQWELLKDQNNVQGKALLNRIAEKYRLITKLKADIPEHLFKQRTNAEPVRK